MLIQLEELYDSELSGLAYINIPFGGNHGHSSPTFGFAIGQTPTDTIFGSVNDFNSLLNNPTRKSLFDIQYDLTDQRWSRFAFGGINALVYDDVLHANGEGAVLLLILHWWFLVSVLLVLSTCSLIIMIHRMNATMNNK